MSNITKSMRKIAAGIPLWSSQISYPPGLFIIKTKKQTTNNKVNDTIVYFPSCISRVLSSYNVSRKIYRLLQHSRRPVFFISWTYCHKPASFGSNATSIQRILFFYQNLRNGDVRNCKRKLWICFVLSWWSFVNVHSRTVVLKTKIPSPTQC